MTKEALLKAVMEGKVYKKLEEVGSIKEFFFQQWEEFAPDQDSEKYQEFDKKVTEIEAELMKLIAEANSQEAKELLNKQGEIFYDREYESSKFCYEQGFTEGLKLVLAFIIE